MTQADPVNILSDHLNDLRIATVLRRNAEKIAASYRAEQTPARALVALAQIIAIRRLAEDFAMPELASDIDDIEQRTFQAYQLTERGTKA